MLRPRKTRNLRRKAPLWIGIIAGVSAVALVALVVFFTARTVQADAGLSRPATAAPASSPAASATPASLTDPESMIPHGSPTDAARRWSDSVHGIASWYGGVFNGRRTASGEVYDMNAMTACHPTLPFGSIVRVINHRNHRSVVVRITDRGDLVQDGSDYRPLLRRSRKARDDLGLVSRGSILRFFLLEIRRPSGEPLLT